MTGAGDIRRQVFFVSDSTGITVETHGAAMAFPEGKPFGPETVAGFTAAFPPGTRFVVAFSGGADSLALLHAFTRARADAPDVRLCAVHVDHRLHPDSSWWARQCMEVCVRLSVDLTVLELDCESNDAGHVDEGAARAARYAEFERFLCVGDVLCTAHSEDDHVETVLLNLLRGAGPRGLAGIPGRRRLGNATVARPALGVSRADLHAYARATGLPIVHDPANADPRFARTVLRRAIIPALETRWPGMRSAMARTADLNRESARLLDALAAVDLEPAGGIGGAMLDVTEIVALEPARRRNAIAGWLRNHGIASPGERRIDQIAHQVVEARPDAMPCVRIGDVDVRRYRGRMRLVPRMAPVVTQVVHNWRIPETLRVDHGMLVWESCADGGLHDSVRDANVTVRFRGDDARWMRTLGGRGRSLKKRFQSLGIPPWERGHVPLVYAGNALAAIGSVWINPRLAASSTTPGWRVVWTPRS